MTALSFREIENASRISALYGSAIAALTFGIGFAAEKQLTYHVNRLVSSQSGSLGLAVFLGLILAVFISYWFAARTKDPIPGSLLAIGFVAAIYGWCRVGLDFFPSPYLAVLVGPALLHIWAVKLSRRPSKSDEVLPEDEAASFASTSEAA